MDIKKNNIEHIHSTYHGPGTIRGTAHAGTHVILCEEGTIIVYLLKPSTGRHKARRVKLSEDIRIVRGKLVSK